MGDRREARADGSKPTLMELRQMGLVVTGYYPDVNEVRRCDPDTDTWETIPVKPRTIGALITIFEPATEIPKEPTR